MEKRQTWGSRSTFIFAAIGSAVGLGNAWRFPGLAAKYGGGAFLLVYIVAMLVLGIPLLTMEISLGRKSKQGAPGAMRAVNKKAEFIGWAATSNAFAIVTYYSVVFAWVIMMVVYSFKFAGFTGTATGVADAQGLFGNLIKNPSLDWNNGSFSPVWIVLAFLVLAWVLIYLCIRRGTVSAGKVVKYTGIFLPLGFLIILAIRGLSLPGGLNGLYKLFVPDFQSVIDSGNLANMFIDAIGQVFYSLSIMMAIMFAYGSYVEDDANIAEDAVIIAVSDLLISVISGIVMFTTMYGVGMTTSDMSSSGIATAFIIYPAAIVQLTNVGWINALFGAVFYLCLCSLAIDSAFSIVEGVSTAVADKFKLNPHKTTLGVCIVAGVISLLYVTKSGMAWLDTVDNWTNQYNMILVGVLECVAVGWFFDPNKVLKEANKNTKKYKMPKWWFNVSIKFLAPIILLSFCGWNVYSLFKNNGGVYGGYPLWSNIAAGWMVTILAFLSGFIVKLIINAKKKKGFTEEDFVWEED
jgi:NSS family neurotransmitter:Na+ symporter